MKLRLELNKKTKKYRLVTDTGEEITNVTALRFGYGPTVIPVFEINMFLPREDLVFVGDEDISE